MLSSALMWILLTSTVLMTLRQSADRGSLTEFLGNEAPQVSVEALYKPDGNPPDEQDGKVREQDLPVNDCPVS